MNAIDSTFLGPVFENYAFKWSAFNIHGVIYNIFTEINSNDFHISVCQIIINNQIQE